ncbi:Ger(x)C family spore germination protein [Paenibacillus sp. PAMC21692]|uniref:Ger(x)C family spore germination protein n=1 Tax=Paenibacillus sp. PAMC21692 TaxID=2762320 RepID=UPI00164E2A93|nr:Ger(x)C family spore germination protein [Paenibacillus sp. PAMC21692]QNK57305.1 Ger(x)C family spore germination protein [Paenibacillus sp. PAMC21692]
MKSKSILVLVILSMLLLSGCWNRRELNELAVAVGIAIDKADDNQYKVSVQVVEPNEIAGRKGGDVTPVTMYQSIGRSIFEAARRMTTVSPRKIYFAHLRMLVISEDVARDGLSNVLDFLSRDHELRTDYFIVVARHTSAENTLKILTPIERIPAVKLYSTLESSEKTWAPTTTVTMDELLNTLVSAGRQAVLTGLQVKGNQSIGEKRENVQMVKNGAQLQYSGIAVFKEDKLIGWLNEEQSKAYTYINNTLDSTSDIVRCPDGGIATGEIIRSATKVKGKMIEGVPHIYIDVRSELNVAEVQCSLDLTRTQTISELEQLANANVKGFIDRTIKTMQTKYKVDIFGFGETIRRADPKTWRTLKHNWDEMFPKVQTHVSVEVKIRRLGTVNNSFIEEMKKAKETE